MEWLGNIIACPGFWRGVVYFAMAGGIALDPDQQNAIIGVGLALSGIIHTFGAAKSSKP